MPIAAAMLQLALTTLAHAAPASIDLDDPQQCAACHATVVEEWTQSMHSRSHAAKDPIFAAMLAVQERKTGTALATKCAQCHSPRSPDALDTVAAKTGVSCAACHAVAAVLPGAAGAAALTAAEPGVLLGPHDLKPGASSVHGTGASPPHMRDGTSLCLTCHGNVNNSSGVATCTTGTEAESAGTDWLCTDCHMQKVSGPSGAVSKRRSHASHSFPGPHPAWLADDATMLGQAVDLKAHIDNGVLIVNLNNTAGHGFPTGFPGRLALVKARGLDEAGAVVWQAWTEDPMKESPQSVLTKVYVDDKGQPTLPPFAAKLAKDTRLAPGEQRTVRYPLPKGVHTVEVELLFMLLPKPAAKALQLEGTPEAAPKVIHRVTATDGVVPDPTPGDDE